MVLLGLVRYLALIFALFASSSSQQQSQLQFLDDTQRHELEHLALQQPQQQQTVFHEDPSEEEDAGFLTIRDSAKVFYWFFPSANINTASTTTSDTTDTPLVIWFQGGPGSSSMIGNFQELGPLRMSPITGALERNPHSWTNRYHLLFIENPVGVGYQSGIKKPPKRLLKLKHEDTFIPQDQPVYSTHGFCRNQQAVAQDFLLFMTMFLNGTCWDGYKPKGPTSSTCQDHFPANRRHHSSLISSQTPIYLVGQSYAGKFIPAIARAIIENNDKLINAASSSSTTNPPSLPPYINLTGIALGNGLTDPPTQIKSHAQQALLLGLALPHESNYIDQLTTRALLEYEVLNVPLNATNTRLALLSYLAGVAGGVNLYDYRRGNDQNNWDNLHAYMNRADVKKKLHVLEDDRWVRKSNQVYEFLKDDVMRSTAKDVEFVLTHSSSSSRTTAIKVLLYQGIYDLRDGYPGQTEWITNMNWSGRDAFAKSVKRIWRMGSNDHDRPSLVKEGDDVTVSKGVVAGFVNEVWPLIRVGVMHAGHLAPMDAPEHCLDMITRFIDHSDSFFTSGERAGHEEDHRELLDHHHHQQHQRDGGIFDKW